MKLSRNRWLAVVIGCIVAADWITKAVVQQRLPLSDRRTIVDGWLSFQHNINPGIAWGWFREMPGDAAHAPAGRADAGGHRRHR